MSLRGSAAPSRQTLRADEGDDPSVQPAERDLAQDDERQYTHLLAMLSVSSGMVGVCMTAIGLIRITKALNNVETLVDDMLAIGAVLFMVTSLLSFAGMRTRLRQTWRGLARTNDVLFCLSLVLVVVATAMLTWEVL
jgi:hypothetical protein